MKKQTPATTKAVTVLNVYKFNHIARICFIVESSNEVDQYNTCFNGDVNHSSCTCKGGDFHNCYHVKQLTARAAEYFESRKPVATPASREQAALNGNRAFSLLR